ncbi:MAG: hypothetical protein QMD13_03265 [Candidatus Bathyarchaeia archaeon]|nr:hypothetical protein [Candidatus Bathyarchaeia archaeon]
MSPYEKYGKRIQITFRITPVAMDRLERAAALFRMTPGEYAKAVLYRDLGVFDEPLDRRRRSWRRQKKRLEQELEEGEEEPLEIEKHEDF